MLFYTSFSFDFVDAYIGVIWVEQWFFLFYFQIF